MANLNSFALNHTNKNLKPFYFCIILKTPAIEINSILDQRSCNVLH